MKCLVVLGLLVVMMVRERDRPFSRECHGVYILVCIIPGEEETSGGN